MVHASGLARSPGKDVAKTGLYQGFGPQSRGRIYAKLCSDVLRSLESSPWLQTARDQPKMTISVAHSDAAASPSRGLLPLWVGISVYALFLVAGNRLLIDPDTMWQITV